MSAPTSNTTSGDRSPIVTGSVEGVGVAIDSTINLTQIQQAQDFQRLSLDVFAEPYFPQPKDTRKWIATLKMQRALILCGPRQVDKLSIACHIAWQLRQEINSVSSNGGKPLEALRWKANSDTTGLRLKVVETSEPTVFILPQVSDSNLREEDINALRSAAQLHHYIIISTDDDNPWPYATTLSQLSEKLTQGLFETSSLCEMLLARLKQEAPNLPIGQLPKVIDKNTPLGGQLTPWQIALQIGEPRDVQEIVARLCHAWQHSEHLAPNYIADLIKEVVNERKEDPERQLRTSYSKLDARSQLLSLGLCLFTDLYEDQCFAALERIAERIWRARDPQLCAFDYEDAHKLRAFFTFDDAGGGLSNRIVHARVPNQRQIMLRLAWDSQRRQIFATLPALVALVQQSVNYNADHLAIFPTEEYRAEMRDVIGETISDIGLIDRGGIWMTLFNLAANHQLEVQAVAADAIARWRQFGKEQQVFTILSNWWQGFTGYHKYSYDKIVNAFLSENPLAELQQVPIGMRASVCVRATVVLAIGFASQYDVPDDLAPELEELLIKASHDKNSFVRNRLESYTLPVVVPRHLKQLSARNVLRDMTERGLEQAIGASLAIAYRISPKEVLAVIREWWQDSLTLDKAPSNEKVMMREALQATVAYTCGAIDYSNSPSFPMEGGFRTLSRILSNIHHPHVRKAALIAIIQLAKQNFAIAGPLLPNALASINDNERPQIVSQLKQIYLDQIKQLKGDDSAYHDQLKMSLPIWIPPAKPAETPVERELLRWMKDDKNPIAEQIAVQAIYAIEPIKQFVDGQAKDLAEQRKQEAEALARSETKPMLQFKARRSSDWYTAYLVPVLATIGAWRYLGVIDAVLPEVLYSHIDKITRRQVTSFLGRWKELNDRDINVITRRLHLAIWLSEHSVAVMATLFLIMLTIAYVVVRSPLLQQDF